jgi:hypothetical protein
MCSIIKDVHILTKKRKAASNGQTREMKKIILKNIYAQAVSQK